MGFGEDSLSARTQTATDVSGCFYGFYFHRKHRDPGDFDPAGSNVSGEHSLCLFGFYPDSQH